MIADLPFVTSVLQLIIGCLGVVMALLVFDTRRDVKRHLDERRRRSRDD